MPTFLAIVFRPRATWESLRRGQATWDSSLLHHALPLTLLPAVAWPVGLYMQGSPLVSGAGAMASAFASTLLLTLACLVCTAAAIYALSAFFEARRDWNAAVALSAYSATPVLLAGGLLFMPVLVVAGILALLHALVLLSVGAEVLLDCRSSDCPGFVAGVALASAMASMALGALCSAIGLI